ncbi:MAG: hypothetical protein U0746_13310 [Gemmataceae bacterium]
MSTEAASPHQTKQREFMQLLPLTLAIAGLPQAHVGSYFNEGQMDARATSLRAAYKVARQLIIDVSK